MKNDINTAAIKAGNRARMPTVAKLVDEYREMFPGLKVTYASEGGVTLGRRPRSENVFRVPSGYCKPAGGWR